MEENNKKGFGIFYAVVGVATLVVAIVGATFAYFSASAESQNFTGGTAEATSMKLTVTPVYGDPEKSTGALGKLIPMASKELLETAINKTNRCVADGKNVACHIYKIDLVTNGKANLNVKTNMKIDVNPATNWRWQVVTGTAEGGFTPSGLAKTGVGTDQLVGDVSLTNDNKSTTTTYYVVIWLEEAEADNNNDTGKTYTGTVSASAVDSSGQASGLTATFTA